MLFEIRRKLKLSVLLLINKSDAVVGVKAGAALLNGAVETDGMLGTVSSGGQASPSSHKISGITPVLGIYAEKNVTDDLNVRLEADYRFNLSKKIEGLAANEYEATATRWLGNRKATIDSKLRGFAVRLVGVYNFK